MPRPNFEEAKNIPADDLLAMLVSKRDADENTLSAIPQSGLYTTTAAWADALSLTSEVVYRHLYILNETGESVLIGFGSGATAAIFKIPDNGVLLLDNSDDFEFQEVIRAKGTSGGAGLFLAAW